MKKADVELSSNTRVSLFRSYATAGRPFRNIVQTTKTPNAFSVMDKLDQDDTCSLQYAADICKDLTAGLLKSKHVSPYHGEVTAANFEDHKSKWVVQIHLADSSPSVVKVIAPRVILCTGSAPITPAPPVMTGSHIESLELDTVLKPSLLLEILPRIEPTTVAVIGASHSAILAIMNLVDLARTTHPHLRLKWFTRHPLRYAEYMDGWILRDNTGLKGQAAAFAQQQLEDSRLPTSEAGRFIEKIDTSNGKEAAAYETYFPSCTHIVYAVGYKRNPLPAISRNGRSIPDAKGKLDWDSEFGGFLDEKQDVIPGLHGAGIAFPERVVDPYGNVEHAVGFYKFVKFLQKIAPRWI